ncbi:surface-adhesin E family protein [Kosakonia sacchari]|uniref:surface-adhesin E family protein n=1 Tax=Kosakonia sacchari TaxID=1158459 RepID=UPI0015852F9F|nr:surface-adhesin E family protein [Kosakonia sacchari]NUL38173.1 hypothetical protein [Kosakonia sacchari]
MKKSLFLGSVLLLISGCTSHPGATATQEETPPKQVVKFVTLSSGVSYLDFRTISLYDGNPYLRRIDVIHNYTEGMPVKKDPLMVIRSERQSLVVNCDTHQFAHVHKLFFSEHFATGDKIARMNTPGQWQDYPPTSLIGITAGLLCKLPAERLPAEPERDTQTPDLFTVLQNGK